MQNLRHRAFDRFSGNCWSDVSYATFRGRDMRVRIRSRQDGWEDAEAEDSKKVISDDVDVGVEW